MVNPMQAVGKFVVMSVPNGPDGKPIWGNNRQQLTGFYLMSAGVAVASLDAVDEENRKVILEASQSFKNNNSDDAAGLTVPTFMYFNNAMAEALLGAASLKITRVTR